MAWRNLRFQLGLWLVVVLAFAFVGGSILRREVSLLPIAAWSFILVFPVLQVLIQEHVGVGDPHRCAWLCWSAQHDDEKNDAEEEVTYKLRGNVVKVKDRERLKSNGTDLSDMSRRAPPIVAENSGGQNRAFAESLESMWYNDHMDKKWYQAGAFSFWVAIGKAMLNIHSVTRTPTKLDLLTRDPDTPGWVGMIWVVSIEVPYMFLILLPFFLYTVVRLLCSISRRERIGGRLGSPEGAGKLVVQLSGVLKSLGRFSALNLLEFIRIDDFMDQDNMQRLMSIIGAVIGFLAFRCKIVDISFVVSQHAHHWTFWQWIRLLALINNMVSITDKREKMIFVALQTKRYRKDRWFEAVGVHLLDIKFMDDNGEVTAAWEHEIVFRALKRLVSMGPDDVHRLIEDLIIEKHQSNTGQRQIPKQIWDDCWNWQLSNIVGVVRFVLFWVRADEIGESASFREQVLLEGKVSRALRKQKKALTDQI